MAVARARLSRGDEQRETRCDRSSRPNDEWTTIDTYKPQFEHPWWKEQGERARTGGHGGMDYIMAWRLVTCMREGLVPDFDVYDAASSSSARTLVDLLAE